MPAGLAACDRDVMPTSTRTITPDIMPRVVRFMRGLLTGSDGTSVRRNTRSLLRSPDVQVANSPYLHGPAVARRIYARETTMSRSRNHTLNINSQSDRYGIQALPARRRRRQLPLLHIRRRAGTGEEVLARRREDVDDLRVFDKPGL